MSTARRILEDVAAGRLSVNEAAGMFPEPDGELGFATVDRDRLRRRGLPEVVYAPGKSPSQIVAIVRDLIKAGQDVFVTRVSAETAEAVQAAIDKLVYHPEARALTYDAGPRPPPGGCVAVVTAGTSDIPVGAEAALTAERMGALVERVNDVGVAGLHRLAKHIATLRRARVVVVVAGMEGALPSVVGGLIDRPVIAVPTSVGYGTHLRGVAALLAMLNSCVPGIAVVNIDNGFGAGVAAAMINRLADQDKGAKRDET
jgi:NCAIR mutase (PurE)-related protein